MNFGGFCVWFNKPTCAIYSWCCSSNNRRRWIRPTERERKCFNFKFIFIRRHEHRSFCFSPKLRQQLSRWCRICCWHCQWIVSGPGCNQLGKHSLTMYRYQCGVHNKMVERMRDSDSPRLSWDRNIEAANDYRINRKIFRRNLTISIWLLIMIMCLVHLRMIALCPRSVDDVLCLSTSFALIGRWHEQSLLYWWTPIHWIRLGWSAKGTKMWHTAYIHSRETRR